MLVGFKCPKDKENRKFDYCFNACSEHCHPTPLLYALSDQREVTPGTFSVTEILKPFQQVHFERTCDFYRDPASMMWAVFGTAVHHVISSMETRINGDFAIEVRFSVGIETPHGIATLRGTPDLYDKKKKILWDFKVKPYFNALKFTLNKEFPLKELGDHYQLNLYRVWGQPEAEKLKLCYIVRDHNKSVMREGVPPILDRDVPIYNTKVMQDLTVERMTTHFACELGKQPPPECTTRDRWNGNKCGKYCGGSEHCPQYKR